MQDQSQIVAIVAVILNEHLTEHTACVNGIVNALIAWHELWMQSSRIYSRINLSVGHYIKESLGWLSEYVNHIYPHKQLRKINLPSAITRQAAHVMCGLMSDLVICNHRKEMVMHDTECPYCDQVSLNNTKLKLKLTPITLKQQTHIDRLHDFSVLCASHVHCTIYNLTIPYPESQIMTKKQDHSCKPQAACA